MCASASGDFFHCPAYKLMISDIRSATSSHPNKLNSTNDLKSIEDLEQAWVLSLNEIETKKGKSVSLKSVNPSKPCVRLNLNLIWVQGTVLRIKDTGTGNESLVITDDEKEEAIIHEYNTVPGGDHENIKIGSYVGALGQVWANKPQVIIKATKIMYLSDKPMCQSIWKDEVNYGKAFLAGLITPII